jgi:hypothetical protein
MNPRASIPATLSIPEGAKGSASASIRARKATASASTGVMS